MLLRLFTLAGLLLTLVAFAAPADFPAFEVPGREKEMQSLRDLFWLHYPGSGPKSTLWDEWLPDAALWPAVDSDGHSSCFRADWARAMGSRIIDPEGYTATHQHASIAHQLGWPFPFWNQGKRGFGWHFSFTHTIGMSWRQKDVNKPDGWVVTCGHPDAPADDGWALTITNSAGLILPPPRTFDTFESPFIQLRWKTTGFKALRPCLEWTTLAQTNFSVDRRVYFDPPKPGAMVYSMIPMFRHPAWTGEVAQLRIVLGNAEPGNVTVQALFSTYDTRHNINAQNFVRGSAKYFWWSGDVQFLCTNINRMRTSLRYVMTEHQALDRKVVMTTWVGHDGRTGLRRTAKAKELIHGQGIGNNYWDLMPFGNLDCYATVQYYDALRTMEQLEREVRDHPEWQVPLGALALDPAMLARHAAEVKAEGNKLFWNDQTGRFNACIDADGKSHDYGFTFLNCEAIYYDFATPEHAARIFTWLDGKREVAGDTSRGSDIYFWRFGPRSTTLRNIDWYMWAWSGPETIPWGGQVQDGGAVLGFSYHDMMSRLRVLGPDNAWERLREVIRWFDEVQAAGGYRKYYDGKRPGTLQGGGTAGGLGLDSEFFESVLVPQVVLNGFLGFRPHGDGFSLDPRMPSSWPELRVTRIRHHHHTLNIRAQENRIELAFEPALQPTHVEPTPLRLHLAGSGWKTSSPIARSLTSPGKDSTFELRISQPATITLEK